MLHDLLDFVNKVEKVRRGYASHIGPLWAPAICSRSFLNCVLPWIASPTGEVLIAVPVGVALDRCMPVFI